MTTAAEMVTAIDAAILDLVENGFEEVRVMNRSYRRNDLDKLQKVRQYYHKLSRGSSTVRLGDFNV